MLSYMPPLAVPNGNASSSRPASQLFYGDAWDSYDRLPEPVRHALQQANQDWCPKKIAQVFRTIAELVPDRAEAAALYVQAFHQSEDGEAAEFSALHRRRHGTHTPHVLAGATLLRDPPGLVRRTGRRRR